ncbi:GNAT family N-acetyltransferase [Oxalobacter formigenes]|uniref:GNAT family N-acetyltransferase n=1 Tax=Oxalobacter formigenes TaxID=847 RepID=UPI0022AF19BA|nr:GNAT family N-acetyltransferase [Oxalobacter formigenes]WAW00934.1 GNAT family N-acetyltransferase [Oxalobacter formigenes]
MLKAVDEVGVIIGSVRAREKGDTLHIAKLMVLPERQGRGIGTQLLVAVEKACPKPRYELFTSNVSLKNLKLYEGLGYVRFKEEEMTPELKFVYMEKKARVFA